MMFNFHYKINCCQSCSYQIVAYAVNNEGVLWDLPRVPTHYNFAWVPHTFEGSDPDPPLFRTLSVGDRDRDSTVLNA